MHAIFRRRDMYNIYIYKILINLPAIQYENVHYFMSFVSCPGTGD